MSLIRVSRGRCRMIRLWLCRLRCRAVIYSMAFRVYTLAIWCSHCSSGWFAMIDGGKLILIGPGSLLMRALYRRGISMMFIHSRSFLRGGLSGCSARPMETDACIMPHYVVVHIGVVYHSRIDMAYSSIVTVPAATPLTAIEARAFIPISVAYATVVAHMFAPIAMVPAVVSALIIPIAGSPEETSLYRGYPDAGHPVISVRRVSPITRCP